MLRILLALMLACAFVPARAADTTSPLLQLLLMEQGAHNNDWGLQTNYNLERVENAIAGTTTKVLGGSDVTLTDDEARSNTLIFTGTLSANVNVIVPARNKSWIVRNDATVGSYTVSLKTSSGDPVVVPAGIPKWYWSDGTDITDLAPAPTLTTNTLYANAGAGAGVTTYADFFASTSTTPATFSTVILTAAAGTARPMDFKTASALRWRFGADSTAEGGSNAGSDLALTAYADDGSTILTSPLLIKRSTGNIGINASPSSTYKVDVGGSLNATAVYQGAAQIMVPGEIKTFAMNTCPTGMLALDGSAVSRTTYASLFANVSTTWGAGDGSTTFNLPDARGQFMRGWDNGAGVDPARAFASNQTDDLKAHTHSAPTIYTGTYAGLTGEAFAKPVSTSVGVTGSTGGTETRPKNIAVLYCIAY